MSDDITFCDNRACKNKKCERNPKNIKHKMRPHSFARFVDCKNWNRRANDEQIH